MSLNISLPSLFLILFLIIPLSSSFNITKILEQGSDFTTFNTYLTQTQLANQINSRRTITVLAVDNSAISAISGRSNEVMKKILSIHVILDYYDEKKLTNLPKNKATIVTTLFQSTGNAIGRLGFLNVTSSYRNGVTFSSANGTSQAVKFVSTFASQPYDISVLQVSGVIIPSNIENTPNGNSSSNTNSSSSASPKSSPPSKSAPTPSPTSSNKTNNSSAPSSDDSPPTSETPTEAPDSGSLESPSPSADAPSESVADGGDKKSSSVGVVASGYAPIAMTIFLFAMFF